MKGQLFFKPTSWIVAGVGILLVCVGAQTVSAATLTYDLVDVELGFDGRADGFFTLDEATDAFLAGEITTSPTNNTVFAGATYRDLVAETKGSLLYLSSSATGPDPFVYQLLLTVETNALGSAQIDTNRFTLFEGARFGSSSGFTVGERLALSDSSGELVLRSNTGAVPEPMTVLGSLTAVGMGLLLRKRKKCGQ